jgi:hypothetical protein
MMFRLTFGVTLPRFDQLLRDLRGSAADFQRIEDDGVRCDRVDSGAASWRATPSQEVRVTLARWNSKTPGPGVPAEK